MEILFTALEFAPFVQDTPAAESIASLAKALQSLGHQVNVVVPARDEYQEAGLLLARRLSTVDCGDGKEAILSDVQLPSGIELTTVSAEGLQLAGVASATTLTAEQAQSLGDFSRAVASLCEMRITDGAPPEVVHAHDFGGGLALLALSQKGVGGLGTVLTVHDATRTGAAGTELAGALGIPSELATAQAFGMGDGLSVLKGTLGIAGRVATPSPAYARHLCAPEQHGGLSRAFSAVTPLGIIEGVDLAVYNPATDAVLPVRFDAANPGAKKLTRAQVLADLGLDVDATRPLVLVEPGRLALAPPASDSVGEAPLSTVISAIPALLRLDLQLVIAGFGAITDAQQTVLEAAGPQVFWAEAPTPTERRRLLGAADFYLGINRHNPGAHDLAQAARYGAIPIAFAADAATDLVVDVDAELATGTGFLFDSMTQRSLTSAVTRAAIAYRKPAMGKLLRRVMRQDFAWDRPARRYLQVYQQAVTPTVA